jgi:hypothetical protein
MKDLRVSFLPRAPIFAAALLAACAHPPTARRPAPATVLTDSSQILVATAPGGLLAPNGEREIQQALVVRGFLARGRATGVIDRETRRALRAFQASQSLPATGLPGYETVERLGLNAQSVFLATKRPRSPPPGG